MDEQLHTTVLCRYDYLYMPYSVSKMINTIAFVLPMSLVMFIPHIRHPYINDDAHKANVIGIIEISNHTISITIKMTPNAVPHGSSARNPYRTNYIDGSVIYGNGYSCTEWLLACTYWYRFAFLFVLKQFHIALWYLLQIITEFLVRYIITIPAIQHIEAETKWQPCCRRYL